MDNISSYLLAILQFITITGICVYEYKRKSIAVFLWAMLLLLFGVMHMLTVLVFEHEYPIYVYDEASVFVLLFSLLYLVIRFLQKKKSIIVDFETKNTFITSKQNSYVKITFFVLLISVGYKIYSMVTYTGSLLDTS